MTIISTSVSETTETVSGIGGNLVVTSSGSIVNDNGDEGIDTTNTEQVISVDGLVYSVGDETGTGIDIGAGETSLYVNGQVEGGAGVVTGAVTGVTIMVGGQGTIAGLAGVGVEFGGNFDTPVSTDNLLQNAGDISSSYEAVLDEYGGDDQITNSGVISGLLAINLFGNVATDTVDNSGTIEGSNGSDTAAIATAASTVGIDIINSGVITDGAANPAGSARALVYFDDNSGTTSTIDNTGSITGSGYVVQSISDILDISNSGTIHGGLYSTAAVDVDNSGVWKDQAGSAPVFLLDAGSNSVTNAASGEIDGTISIAHSHDTFNNAGSIDGGITLASGTDTITNGGSVGGPITFTGTGGTNSLTDSGKITGSVTLSGGSNTVDNSGTVDGERFRDIFASPVGLVPGRRGRRDQARRDGLDHIEQRHAREPRLGGFHVRVGATVLQKVPRHAIGEEEPVNID